MLKLIRLSRPKRPLICALIWACSFATPAFLNAKPVFNQYQQSVPTVKDTLGYEMGARISSSDAIYKYFQTLSERYSERVRLIEYGRSWEDRPLYFVAVSAPHHIAQLDKYSQRMAAFGDPRKTSAREAEQLMNKLPSSVWLSYGVHGNEISSPEAAMMTLYHLLADTSDETKNWLENTVVFIDPLQNPDGRARFVSRYYATVGLTHDADRRSAEHNEPWPQGRSNHYLFDLNRDWIALTQPEIKGQVAALKEFPPLLFVDLHEMGGDSSYYFTPEARPYNPYITESQREILHWVGRNNANWFDNAGYDYYTREIFDAFYPGYGASWPLYSGSVAMTYEMASARGHTFARKDGTTLTYLDGVERHFTSSLATIQTASERREALLKRYRDYRVSAVNEGRESEQRTLIIADPKNVAGQQRLASLLQEHGIEVSRNSKAIDACGNQYPEGSYFIDMAQPNYRLIRVLLDEQINMAGDFIEQQQQRKANLLADQIYDVTGWSLPLMFNVNISACDEVVRVPTAQEIIETIKPGTVQNLEARVAFLVRSGDTNSSRFIASALRAGVNLKQSELSFTHEKAGTFAAGSVIVTRADNQRSDLPSVLTRLARETGVDIVGVDSSWIVKGPNFGSENVQSLAAPTIAMAWDEPVSSLSAGHTRFVIERQIGYPVMAIRTTQLVQSDLAGIDVLVMPESQASYSSYFSTASVEKLRRWVEQGGVLITLGSATGWAVEANLLSTHMEYAADSATPAMNEEETLQAAQLIESESQLKEVVKASDKRPDYVPGALVRVKVDQNHWLTAGVQRELVATFTGDQVFAPLSIDDGRNLAWFAQQEEVLASGLLWPEIKRQIPFKPQLMVEPMGDGMLIAYAQSPTYRAYMDGWIPILTNSLFLAPAKTH
ncbi:M14 family zinc carboxypeptidase [Idiomarina sp.]|uniref:M14 family zinc carboxypeptidase n=1 Tax=Idiomarina sp. TaxID=1874361 RepID=UPI0025869640|nr:M14 family zinc carboxypeptidase [Idiomarina sp.]